MSNRTAVDSLPKAPLPLQAASCLLAQAARNHTLASVLRARSAGEHGRNQLRRSRRMGAAARSAPPPFCTARPRHRPQIVTTTGAPTGHQLGAPVPALVHFECHLCRKATCPALSSDGRAALNRPEFGVPADPDLPPRPCPQRRASPGTPARSPGRRNLRAASRSRHRLLDQATQQFAGGNERHRAGAGQHQQG